MVKERIQKIKPEGYIIVSQVEFLLLRLTNSAEFYPLRRQREA